MTTPIGEFEVLVLMAVLRLDEGAYGPAVLKEIEHRTGRGVSRGAVYITLDRLAQKGLLGSRLADAPAEGGGRPRRYYRVAPKGLRAIKRMLTALEQMRAGLGPLLGEA
ncbi:MAG: helix-turn-helix transcriptional regulator [Vicinamibacterales bacterium]